MKRTRFDVLLPMLLMAALPLPAHAQEPVPAFTVSANVGVFSQYIFRGISYSQEKPAVQGGFDLAHSSGLYLGVWGTNVSGDALPNAVGEIDVYGGYAHAIGDFTLDVGFLQFLFPGGEYNGSGENFNSLELYAGVTWKILNVKYSQMVTDYFGFNDRSMGMGRGDSDGSCYLEANVNYEFLPGWTAQLHVGRQDVKHYDQYSFTDWKVGVTRNFEGGWQAGLSYVDTNVDKNAYLPICNGNGNGCKQPGDPNWLAFVKRTF